MEQESPCPEDATQGLPVAIDPELVRRVNTERLQIKTAVDGPKDAVRVGYNCYEDKCRPSGCATCVRLQVYLPLTAQIVDVVCWSTATGEPSGDVGIRPVPCGRDNGYDYFDWPRQTTTPENTVVYSLYYNRSDSRTRTVKLEVRYME